MNCERKRPFSITSNGLFFIIVTNSKWVCTWWQWYYNTQKTQNNTHTHSKQYTTHKITNTIFQPYKETENTEHTKKMIQQ